MVAVAKYKMRIKERKREMWEKDLNEMNVLEFFGDAYRLMRRGRRTQVELSTMKRMDGTWTSAAITGRGYKVVENERKKPMVLFYDEDKGMPEDQVLENLYVKNFGGLGMTEQEFLRAVKVRRKVSQASQRGEKEKGFLRCVWLEEDCMLGGSR